MDGTTAFAIDLAFFEFAMKFFLFRSVSANASEANQLQVVMILVISQYIL